MPTPTTDPWRAARRWVRIYSWITLAAAAYGIAAAHVPPLIDHPWSTCDVAGSRLGCILVVHLFELPLLLLFLFVAWYGLRRFSPEQATSYGVVLAIGVMGNLVFFTFETGLLLDGLRRGAPLWEPLALTSVATILAGGSALGLYVMLKLTKAITHDDRGEVTP